MTSAQVFPFVGVFETWLRHCEGVRTTLQNNGKVGHHLQRRRGDEAFIYWPS